MTTRQPSAPERLDSVSARSTLRGYIRKHGGMPKRRASCGGSMSLPAQIFPANPAPAASLPPECTTPAVAVSSGNIVFECESITISQRKGRLVVEVSGATTALDGMLPRCYLNPTQAAALLQLSTRTLRKLMAHRTNPIPYIRLNPKCPRFSEEKLREWAEKGASVGAKRAKRKLAANPLPAMAGIFGRRFV